MKNIILILLSAILFSSCGLFKSTFKHKSQHSEVTKTSIKHQKDSVGSKIDKSQIVKIKTTTVTETLPPRKVTGQLKTDKKRLQSGVDVIDSAGVKVKVYLDSATNLLKAMASISGHTKKTETKDEEIINNDIKEQSKTNQTYEDQKQVAIESKEKTVEKTPIKMGVVLAIVAIIGFFVFLFFIIKVPRKKN